MGPTSSRRHAVNGAEDGVNGAQPEALPADGTTVVAGVPLPPGHRAGPSRRWLRSPSPSLWLAAPFDGAVAAWQALSAPLRGSGLVPLLLSDLPGQDGRPWESELAAPGPLSGLDGLDGAALLSRLWADAVPDDEEDDDIAAEALDPA